MKHPKSGGTWVRQPDGSLKPEAKEQPVQEAPEPQREQETEEKDNADRSRRRKGE
jgi:hypothetical protein